MLRTSLIMAAAIAVATVVGINLLDRPQEALAPSESTPELEQAATEPKRQGRVTAIPKSADGHFWLEAKVNSSTIRFLVDTGATVVALTPEDAQRIGIDLKTLVYDKTVSTANGQTKAAQIDLRQIQIGQSPMTHIKALVIQEGLDNSLLGMSYLGRLQKFEATPSSLILHP